MGKKSKKDSLKTSATTYYDDSMGHIPEDITMMTPDRLRNAHRYWTNCHNHASSNLTRIIAAIRKTKRIRDITYKEFFVDNKNKRMNNDLARYNAELHEDIVKLDNELVALDIQHIKWLNLTNQCESLKVLCSRDQSYREKEIESYHGKGSRFD